MARCVYKKNISIVKITKEKNSLKIAKNSTYVRVLCLYSRCTYFLFLQNRTLYGFWQCVHIRKHKANKAE